MDMPGRKKGSFDQHLAKELELLIDNAADYAIFLLDEQGTIILWNQGAERIFGWSEDEIVGKPQEILFASSEVKAGTPQQKLKDARENGKIHYRGRWRVRKDGSEFLAEITIAHIRDEAGQAMGFGHIVRDITAEEASKAAIEAREMHLQSILETMPEAMIVIDQRGIIQSFNGAAERMFGYTTAEVVGRNVSILMPSPQSEEHDSYLRRYLETGERRIIGIGRRVLGRRKDGTTFPQELAIGEAIGGGKRVFTGFIRDLSQREAAEEQVRQLQDELLHVSRVSAMGALASTLAHELNQPLTSVTSYVQTSAALLDDLREDNKDVIREALVAAGEQALAAGRLVRRLRTFLARGEVEKTVEPVAKLIEDACVLGLAGATEKGISRTFDWDPGIGSIIVDRIQIQQVLVNLLRNAVEAMTGMVGGQIGVRAVAKSNRVVFSISDTGPGIAPSVRKKLFTAFVSTKQSGMGLGLSICRTIIEAHDGRIWASDNPAGGTIFSFSIPRSPWEGADE
jgi:two-component system sensor kinase FixL